MTAAAPEGRFRRARPNAAPAKGTSAGGRVRHGVRTAALFSAAILAASAACREKAAAPAPYRALPTAAFPAVSPVPSPEAASLPPAKVLAIPSAAPDMSLWSAVRIRAYKTSLQRDPGPPLAILRIPKQRIEVAVLPGTEDWILDRGAGNIEETALPGKPGNVGIAGHRDGFFRTLEHIAKGDPLELETPWGVESYRVTDLSIVEQEDVQVLDPTPQPTVTLVTCYPFYFNGHAPKRFIVRAERSAS